MKWQEENVRRTFMPVNSVYESRMSNERHVDAAYAAQQIITNAQQQAYTAPRRHESCTSCIYKYNG